MNLPRWVFVHCFISCSISIIQLDEESINEEILTHMLSAGIGTIYALWTSGECALRSAADNNGCRNKLVQRVLFSLPSFTGRTAPDTAASDLCTTETSTESGSYKLCLFYQQLLPSSILTLANRTIPSSLNSTNRSQPDEGDVIPLITHCQEFPLSSKRCSIKPPSKPRTLLQQATYL